LLRHAGKTWLYIRWLLKHEEIQLQIPFKPNTIAHLCSLT
jgi:hypothetical protein